MSCPARERKYGSRLERSARRRYPSYFSSKIQPSRLNGLSSLEASMRLTSFAETALSFAPIPAIRSASSSARASAFGNSSTVSPE